MAKRILSISLWLWLGVAVHAASVARMGPDLGLTGQTGWSVYVPGTDSDELAWMYDPAAANMVATIPLGQTLPAGSYRVFVRWLQYHEGSNSTNDTFTVLAGGGSNTTNGVANDWNVQWTEPMTVVATESFSSVVVTFHKVSATLAKILFRGFYITDNLNIIVTGGSQAVLLTPEYPTAYDLSAPVKGNRLFNSGFELGMAYGWSVDNVNRRYSLSSHLTNNAHSGNQGWWDSVDGSGLISRPLLLKSNKLYCVSAWFRGHDLDVGDVTVRLTCENTFLPPNTGGFQTRAQWGTTNNIANDGAWHRLSATGYALCYPQPSYRVRIDFTSSSYLIMDDIQVEEGELSDYAGAAEIEATLIPTNECNIFYISDPPTSPLVIHNPTAGLLSGSVSWKILDYLNNSITNSTTDYSLASGVSATTMVNVAFSKPGHYRWIAGTEEVGFSVLSNITANVGVLGEGTALGLTLVKRAGFNWTRTLSPATSFRWSTVEPTQGAWDWTTPNAHTTAYSNANINVLGVLGDEQNPAWAKTILSDGDEAAWIAAYVKYATSVVARYKGVASWELHNEPYSAVEFGAGTVLEYARYAKVVKQTIDAQEALGFSVNWIIMGGFSYSGSRMVESNFPVLYPTWDWENHIQGVSTHIIPDNIGGNEPSFRSYYINEKGVEVWNTEPLNNSHFYMTTRNSGWSPDGEYIYGHYDSVNFTDQLVDMSAHGQCFLRSMGNGFALYTHYDSRMSHSTMPGSQASIIGYDDTVKPCGLIFITMSQTMNGATNFGVVTVPNADTRAYLWGCYGGSFAWVFQESFTNCGLTVSSPVGVCDIWGNVVTNSTTLIPSGRMPVRVTLDTHWATLSNLLYTCTPSPRASTVPPVILLADVIESGPKTIVRWFAQDNDWTPRDLGLTNLMYSYQMVPWDAGFSVFKPNAFVEYSATTPKQNFTVIAVNGSGQYSTNVTTWSSPAAPPTTRSMNIGTLLIPGTLNIRN